MPLTRRVQVFISQKASDNLDILTSRCGSQKAAIEAALAIAVDPPFAVKARPLERTPVPIPKLNKGKNDKR
jgi:hypothetical protein